MKSVLVFAASGMLALLIGIFLMVSGSLTSNMVKAVIGVAFILSGLSAIGWSVIKRNKNL
ncbi:MAG: hypothetical protein LKF80_16075 [Brevundimonas sp.]|jgi:uncharacterized membrane protein HdeD (DUF308 family)|uniref:CTP synthetase n=1 Tax=Brevundimonas olei TaxID=657642 RepID=A0ABZ2IDQ8_9CAUL|nr:hypothetical protein [Brevundimonas sp.]MCH4269907.1 hypothetical protein [Brevundimonas sp.]